MQEHEYLSGYEQRTTRNSTHVTGQSPAELTEQSYEQLEGLVEGTLIDEGTVEVSAEAEEQELLQDRRSTLRLGRSLVVGLVLSFLGSLAAFWLSGTLLNAPDQVLPLALLQTLADNRVLVLCIPVACLIICYIGLRSLTREIMAVPEYTLDERQKMLRDQAQRSAFKVVKYASVLVPVGFLLSHLPWFAPSAPVAVPSVAVGFPPALWGIQGIQGQGVVIFNRDGFPARHFLGAIQVETPTPAIQAASTSEVVLAAGLLLVGLLVLFSALPMAVLAWKGNA